MKKVLRIGLLLLLLGVFGWTLWFLYQKNQEEPVVYETEQPQYRTIIKKSVATGSVVPRNETFIKPQISGIIQKIYVQAGEVVSAGDLIAKVKVIPDMVALNNAENRVNRAQISLKNADMDYDRNKKLLDQQVISDAEFQVFEIARKQAMEELSAAEDALAIVKEGVSKKAGNASNTLIRSTVSGMVLDVPVEEGCNVIEANTFNEGTTIASVADMNAMIFEGMVDESDIGKVREGMELILTIGAIENKTFDATLEYVSPKGIEEEGAIRFEVRAKVALDPDNFIRAGYSANADIVLEKKEKVLAIKESNLIVDNDTSFVEVMRANKQFEKILVETGISDGINVEVLSGITETDQIKKL